MFSKIHNLLAETFSGKKGRKVLCLIMSVFSLAGLIFGLSISKRYTVNDGATSYTVNTSNGKINILLALAGVSDNDVASLALSNGNTLDVSRAVVSDYSLPTFLACNEICKTFCDIAKDVCFTSDELEEYFASEVNEVVEYKYETVTETIKFKYKTVKSDELEIGQTKVTYGKNGSKKVTYKIKYVDGKKVSKEVYKEEIIKKAVDQVETVGTRRRASQAVMTSDDVDCISTLIPSSPIELDANGRPVNYSKIIEGKGCAYACGNKTATGVKPQPGYVAVNPKQIPYGTKMYIVSADGKYIYGYAVAADTGGFAKKGERIVDLRFNTESECNKFGVRNVIIYILD